MAPKPRQVFKDGSVAPRSSQAMPPPPVPVPQPPPEPQGLLVPEAEGLSICLRSAAVEAGKVYRFYADAKTLGINRHAPYPPRSLIASLGRDVEKYDQLCDAIQSHLQRAINVLKRDLAREENRQRMAEAEAAAKAAASAVPPPSSPAHSPLVPEPPPTSPVLGTHKASLLPLRRQSTISLSNLHRPPFPHKLDLSSATLRLNPDDPLQSGLASPVTLAPKTSMPRVGSDFPFGPDVDMDLTVGDDPTGVGLHGTNPLGDPSVGSSSDKPIELDLDIDMNIFNSDHPGGNIQSGPLTLGEPSATVQIKQEDQHIELDFFKNLPSTDGDTSAVKDDLLASLGTAAMHDAGGSMDAAHDILSAMQPSVGETPTGMTSPGILLAGFDSATETQTQDGGNGSALQPDGGSYDFDLGMLDDSMDMGLFGLDTTNVETTNSQIKPA